MRNGHGVHGPGRDLNSIVLLRRLRKRAAGPVRQSRRTKT
jgi:hypothetical protein